MNCSRERLAITMAFLFNMKVLNAIITRYSTFKKPQRQSGKTKEWSVCLSGIGVVNIRFIELRVNCQAVSCTCSTVYAVYRWITHVFVLFPLRIPVHDTTEFGECRTRKITQAASPLPSRQAAGQPYTKFLPSDKDSVSLVSWVADSVRSS